MILGCSESSRHWAAIVSERVVLIVGGRAAEAYSEALEAIGAIRVQDIPSFRRRLESLRSKELL